MMSDQVSAPLAGVLRILFFLAVAALSIATVGLGVTNVYEAPSSDSTEYDDGYFGYDGVIQYDDDQDYNRNLGLILGAIGSGAIAIGLLAMNSGINPLRAGFLAGGTALVLWGVAQGSQGSDDWLTIFTAGLGLAVLLASTRFLENGMGRLRGPGPSAPPPPSPGSPPAPPPVSTPDDPGGLGGAPSG